ncbi:EAL domain-containing protein [Hydrogenimonas sp.]
MNYIKYLYFVLFGLIGIFIVYFYVTFSGTYSDLMHNIESLYIERAKNISENIVDEIEDHCGEDLVTCLKSDPELRREIEHHMQVLITPTFKYIYALYRDEKGIYRYLLDGSKEDKGEFGNRLEVDVERWNDVYRDKIPKTFYQNDIEELYATHLTPIVEHNETKGILAIDFSIGMVKKARTLLHPLKDIFKYIFTIITVLTLLLLYQTFTRLKDRKKSIIDDLTNVYNRTYLRDFLAKINLSHYQIAMIDIDFFKNINDTYGHKTGDDILREFALILKDETGKEDKIFRFGGEEFLLFIKKRRGKSTLQICIAEKIRQKVEKHIFRSGEYAIKLTSSGGVVYEPHKYKNVQEAIKMADQLLYKAKRTGRNKIVTENIIKETFDLEEDYIDIDEVKRAIEEKRVICHFQPIINLDSGRIVKYEALVRLVSTENEIITPNRFLKTIENTNIYNELTKTVLDISLNTIKQHHIAVSVNLNMSDIQNSKTYSLIKDEIEKYANVSNLLTIELLEYEEITDSTLSQRIEELKSHGVKIALDDFGSGYSNFSIFQVLSIDIVKIDGSLIANIDHCETSQAIVEGILHFCKKLNIDVVAEFVHNKSVLETLKRLHIKCGQGYYFAKPSDTIVSQSDIPL